MPEFPADVIPIQYHFNMLSDGARMDGFHRAIQLAVQPGMKVLDLGGGTGVLSWFAAQQGADQQAEEWREQEERGGGVDGRPEAPRRQQRDVERQPEREQPERPGQRGLQAVGAAERGQRAAERLTVRDRAVALQHDALQIFVDDPRWQHVDPGGRIE